MSNNLPQDDYIDRWWNEYQTITDPEKLRAASNHEDVRVRINVAGNIHTPPDVILAMLDDESPVVRDAALANPKVPKEVFDEVMNSCVDDDINSIAANTSLPSQHGVEILRRGNKIQVQILIQCTEDPLVAALCLQDRERTTEIMERMGSETLSVRGIPIVVDDVSEIRLVGLGEHMLERLQRIAEKN